VFLSSLWFIPVMCVVAGVVIPIERSAIDRWFDLQASSPAIATAVGDP
jgi:hypothetical protein